MGKRVKTEIQEDAAASSTKITATRATTKASVTAAAVKVKLLTLILLQRLAL